jgi:hypothetical protein
VEVMKTKMERVSKSWRALSARSLGWDCKENCIASLIWVTWIEWRDCKEMFLGILNSIGLEFALVRLCKRAVMYDQRACE